MRSLRFILPLLLVAQLAFGLEFGGIDTVYRQPHTAGLRPSYGSIDISKSACVGSSVLNFANGGTNATSASAAFNNLSPMTAMGDTIYGGAIGAGTRLPGNTSTTTMILSQTGDGVNSSAPGWTSVYLQSIAKAGSAALNGAVTLTGGAGVSLVQSGQNITISASPAATTLTSNTTLSNTNGLVKLDSSGGTFTVTLPLAASFPGQIYYIAKYDSSGIPVKFIPSGSDTVGFEVSQSFYSKQDTAIYVSDSVSNWIIF